MNKKRWEAIFNVKRCKIALLRNNYGKEHIKREK